MSTEFPVLENVEDKEYYGRAATEIKNVVDIRYDKQKPLIGEPISSNPISTLS